MGLGGASLTALLLAPPVFAQQTGPIMKEMETILRTLQAALDDQRRLVEKLSGEVSAQREQLQTMQRSSP